MKTFLFTVVPILAVVLGWYLTNLSKPNLKYQLSSPIEMPQGPAQMAITQEIDVANVGSAPAQPVQIKINKKINKPVVIKDSQADNYQIFDTPTGGTELDYDLLRPNGQIKVIVTGNKLTDQDLEIRDQKNVATPALSTEQSSLSVVGSALFGLLLIYWVVLRIRSTAREWAYGQAANHPADFIRKKKSTLLTTDTWDSCVDLALKKLGTEPTYTSDEPSLWDVYQLLDTERPEKVNLVEWNKMLPTLRSALAARIGSMAASAITYSGDASLRKLLNLPKPVAMLDEPWHDLRKHVGRIYLSTVLWKLFSEYSSPLKGVQSVLGSSRPEGVDDRDWDRFCDFLRQVAASIVARSLVYKAKPSEFVSSTEPGMLT